jgi:type II secretory pathway pseudopilin PulG
MRGLTFHRKRTGGFTIAELITVCAIIAILAAIAMPVARFGIRRHKELELRDRLRKITEAIDRYHDLMLMGQMNPGQNQQQPGQLPMVRPAQMQALGADGYPKNFDELLAGVKMSDGKTVRLIRERDLVDPMIPTARSRTRARSAAPARQTISTRCTPPRRHSPSTGRRGTTNGRSPHEHRPSSPQ